MTGYNRCRKSFSLVFFFIFSFSALSFILTGCGGGGGSSTTTSTATTGTISGTVALPNSSSAKEAAITDLTTLTVASGSASTKPDATGKYSLSVDPGANVKVTVTAASGNVVLTAYVDSVTAGATASKDINSTSTAVAMIYEKNTKLTLAQIEASSSLASVKTAVESALTDSTADSLASNTSVSSSAATAASSIATGTSADATAPTISNVSASATSDTAATVTWTTNEAATALVEYGKDGNLGTKTTETTTTQTSQSVSLTGLTASTTYYYKVTSKDAAGNAASSTVASFTTLASGQSDTTAPTLSNVSATASETSATITWTTGEASTSKINYGASSSSLSSSTTEDATKTTSHSVTVTGLTGGTTYYYQAVSKDAAGNTGTSSTASFATTAAGAGDKTSPVISNVNVTATSSGATIMWATDEDSTTQVDYGISLLFGTSTTEDTTKTKSHSVTINGLSASTKYYFSAKSKDASGNLGSSTSSFSTASAAGTDTTGPSISSVSSSNVTNSAAAITWKTDEASTSQIKYGVTSSNLSNSTTEDGTLTTSHSVSLTGLTASTTYYYQVISKDASGNSSNAVDLSFKTLAATETMDTTAPTLSTLMPANGSMVSGNVLINLDVKDNVAVTKCEFFIDSVSVGSGTFVGESCITTWSTTSLTNGSTHTVKATAWDAAGNSATTPTSTVTVNNANTATISGTVTFTGNSAAGAIVYVESPNGQGGPDGPLTTADSSGNFTLSGVQAGTWNVGAVKDVNGDGNPATCGTDANTKTATSVTVTAGQTQSGVSVTIEILSAADCSNRKVKDEALQKRLKKASIK